MWKQYLNISGIFLVGLSLAGCDSSEDPAPSCDGSLSIQVSNVNQADCNTMGGSIMVAANGGAAPYQFQLGGANFQGNNQFDNIGPGKYTITVKDGNDCTAEVEAQVLSGLVQADIQPVLNTNCAIPNCHDGSNTNLPNFTDAATVRANAANIKTRTGNQSMPPSSSGRSLTNEEIRRIACWVDDGAPS